MMRMSIAAEKTWSPVNGVSRNSNIFLPCGCGADDLEEGIGVEGGAPDERAVHVRAGEELSSVLGFHAPAVEHESPFCKRAALSRQTGANRGVGLLGLVRPGHFSGAD